jgi:hypothetical protein
MRGGNLFMRATKVPGNFFVFFFFFLLKKKKIQETSLSYLNVTKLGMGPGIFFFVASFCGHVLSFF